LQLPASAVFASAAAHSNAAKAGSCAGMIAPFGGWWKSALGQKPVCPVCCAADLTKVLWLAIELCMQKKGSAGNS
jgi:hypothetical protein